MTQDAEGRIGVLPAAQHLKSESGQRIFACLVRFANTPSIREMVEPMMCVVGWQLLDVSTFENAVCPLHWPGSVAGL